MNKLFKKTLYYQGKWGTAIRKKPILHITNETGKVYLHIEKYIGTFVNLKQCYDYLIMKDYI